MARTFRVINIDADPAAENFRRQDIAVLKSAGRNRVISYLNVGSCERYRTYWKQAPPGYLSCKDNRKAQRGTYRAYPDETWMNPSDPDYQRLMVEVVAPPSPQRASTASFSTISRSSSTATARVKPLAIPAARRGRYPW